jgi:hypothetical protein
VIQNIYVWHATQIEALAITLHGQNMPCLSGLMVTWAAATNFLDYSPNVPFQRDGSVVSVFYVILSPVAMLHIIGR